MAMSLEPSEKGANRHSAIKCLSYGENFVKTGQVDHEIALLKKFILKKKLTQAEHNALCLTLKQGIART